MKTYLYFVPVIVLASLAASCSSGGDGSGSSFPVTACTTTVDDSQSYPNDIINSAFNGSPTYHAFYGPRENNAGNAAILDYMVHEVPMGVTPKNALVVLIAGGQLNAGITSAGGNWDLASDGGAVGFAGGNFLVRSAHLFTYRGYRVLTVDRPSDYVDFLDPTVPFDHGSALDVYYRTQVEHAVDLSAMINRVQTATNSREDPVIILGTSRGGISAVAQNKLAAAIAISNPVTSGTRGDPVSATDASQVSSPAHVLWHVNDSCVATQPADSEALVSAFTDGSGNAVSGGFDAGINPCGAYSYHGFLGIESCAVETSTGWIDNELATLPTPRPVAGAVSQSTTTSTPLVFDISGAAVGTSLTYSLPFPGTSLDGTVSINPVTNMVTYTPPLGVTNVTDTFVYVVNETGGGTSHNVVSVTITP